MDISEVLGIRGIEEAGRQLERLIKLKQQQLIQLRQSGLANLIGRQKSLNRQIATQSAKTVELFAELIRLHPDNLHTLRENNQTPNRFNVKSHSRTYAKPLLLNPLINSTNSKTMNSTLKCTLAYIYTNFENRHEDAAAILFNSKAQIEKYILMVLTNRKYQAQNMYNGRESMVLAVKYENLVEYLSQNSNQMFAEFCSSNFSLIKSYIRVCTNLVINLILQEKYTCAVQEFDSLVKLLETMGNPSLINQSIEFISLVWFGACDFLSLKQNQFRVSTQLLDKVLVTRRQLSVQQAVSMTHLVFRSDLFIPGEFIDQQMYGAKLIELLQRCLQTFIHNEIYTYAFFSLRHLIQSDLQIEQKQQYQHLLSGILQSTSIDLNFSLQNLESVSCFRCIIQTLTTILKKYHYTYSSSQKQQQNQGKIRLFRLIINLEKNNVLCSQSIGQKQKLFIVNSLNQMSSQSNIQIVDDLLQQHFAKKTLNQIENHCKIIITSCQKNIRNSFDKIKFNNNLFFCEQTKNRLPLSQRCLTSNSFYQTTQHLKNTPVSPNRSKRYLKLISTSIDSQVGSINPSISQRHRIFQSSNLKPTNQHKKLNKMIRLCEYGAFLNKRNFNSDGGEFKFIKITSTSIKWSKNAQKIEESSQSYPLKDLKGILYGKLTPNFKKPSNKSLKEQNCFSLVLQKRTMDFYCRDYNEAQTWVCGLSQILKRQGHKIAGYTPGKMRWRKMFATLRQAFIQPLKMHQRNQYYFENAYALILFKKNGYNLQIKKRRKPSRQQ